MTAKQIYLATKVELNQMKAPALTLIDFNYYANKATRQFVNLVYAAYDTSQQTTDDLRAIQSSCYLVPTKVVNGNSPLVSDPSIESGSQSLYGAAYECWLPMDYTHLLNCVCTYEIVKPYSCYGAGSFVQYPATRLTSDAKNHVFEDYYNRPSPENPYYQIYNQNRENTNKLPIDPVRVREEAVAGESLVEGTDIDGEYKVTSYDDETLAKDGKAGGNFPRTFSFKNGRKESVVERTAAQRLSNPTGVRLEINYGRDDSTFVLREVQVDYIKSPQYIRLTQEEVDLTQDVSQIIEWPDYICDEIIAIIIRLILERNSDPRLSNNIQINQTVSRAIGQSQASSSA